VAKITKNSISGLIAVYLKNYLVGTAFRRKVLGEQIKEKKLKEGRGRFQK